MNTVAFDTHHFVKRLTEAGMPEQQAEVLAEEQTHLIESHLATKQDIIEVKREIKALETQLTTNIKALETRLTAEITARIAECKTDIVKWMFAALIGQGGLIVALIKLL